jgi:hypothetical protein
MLALPMLLASCAILHAQVSRTWINALPSKPAPSPTDVVPIVEPGSGNAYKAPVSAFGGSGGATVPVTPLLLKGNNAAGVAIATPHVDYSLDAAQTGTNADNTWTAGVTSFAEGAALTTNRALPLPATSGYADGSLIRLSDSKTLGNFGRLISPSGSDTLNGSNASAWVTAGYYKPFLAGGYGGGNKTAWFQKQGTNWQTVSDNYVAKYFVNPADPSARVVPDASNLPTATDTVGTFPSEKFVFGIVPSASTDPTQNVVTGVDAAGNLIYNTIAVVPSTSLHTAGESLQVLSDGSFDFAPSASGSSPYQVLDNSTNPVVWNCISGTRAQKAILNMPAGNRAIQINGAASGFDFDLIVKQDGGGSRTITALPTGSLVGSGGAGVPTLTSTANAIDWIKGSYTGQGGMQWVWGIFQANLTGAAPPSCATAGVTGATSGTAIISQNAANRAYLSNLFVATETSICRFDANLQQVGAPNYTLKAYICPDAVRATFAGATSTNGNNTVVLNATGAITADVGQAVTGPGIPANSYVGTVDTTTDPTNHRITLSSSRTSNVSVNAGSGAGTGSVAIYGMPGTPINATGSDPVNSTSLPTALTGTGSADNTPASFTNVGVTGLTVGATYHKVLGTTATFGATSWDTADYVNWLQGSGSSTGYNVNRASTITGSSWVSMANAKKQRWTSYH